MTQSPTRLRVAGCWNKLANGLTFSRKPREPTVVHFELTSRAAWRLQGFVGPPWVEILQSNSEASLQGRTRLSDLPQKFWMVLDPVVEPIVLRFEPDQDAGRSTVASDDDFFINCQP